MKSPLLFEDGELAEAPAPIVQRAYDLWNQYAVRNKWQVAKVLDTGRRTALKRAVKDYGGIVGFQSNLEKIQRSDFCMGRIPPKGEHRQFQASLDWFIRPVTVRKVIEDFYNGAEVPSHSSLSARMGPSDEWAKRLRDHKPRGFWPVGSWGPRPDAHGCQAPPAMLEAWRKQHGITVAPAIQETQEQRMAATIVSYRRVGRYDDANRVEEKLAVLEKRPPALVPAPDARDPGVIPPRESPKPTPKYAGNYSGPVTDVIDQYDAIPEGEQYE